jgi:hypothetical protein
MAVPSLPIRGRYPIPSPDGYCPAELDSQNAFTQNCTFAQDITVTGDLTVSGSIAGALTIAAGVEFEGGFTCDVDRFIVADVTGAMTCASTLESGHNGATGGSVGGLTINNGANPGVATCTIPGATGLVTSGANGVPGGVTIKDGAATAKNAIVVDGNTSALTLGVLDGSDDGQLHVKHGGAVGAGGGLDMLGLDALDQVLHLGSPVGTAIAALGGVISITDDANPSLESVKLDGPAAAITLGANNNPAEFIMKDGAAAAKDVISIDGATSSITAGVLDGADDGQVHIKHGGAVGTGGGVDMLSFDALDRVLHVGAPAGTAIATLGGQVSITDNDNPANEAIVLHASEARLTLGVVDGLDDGQLHIVKGGVVGVAGGVDMLSFDAADQTLYIGEPAGTAVAGMGGRIMMTNDANPAILTMDIDASNATPQVLIGGVSTAGKLWVHDTGAATYAAVIDGSTSTVTVGSDTTAGNLNITDATPVNTFSVAGATGNTLVGGSLGVTGVLTATGGISVGAALAGQATIVGGTGTIVVLTAAVGAASLVFITPAEAPQETTTVNYAVTAINPGVSFTITAHIAGASPQAVSAAAAEDTIMNWFIINPIAGGGITLPATMAGQVAIDGAGPGTGTGTVVVNTARVGAGSIILVTPAAAPADTATINYGVSAIVAGVSFTITAYKAGTPQVPNNLVNENTLVNWVIINPA